MKKYFIALIVLLLPMLVYADTCDNSNIVISDINIVESNGYVEEINAPSINNQNIFTDLKFYDVGDSITYSFKVKNNSTEDYNLSKNISSDEYSEFEIITDTKKIKAGEEKIIKLKISYKNRVDSSKFSSGKYISNKELTIVLGDSFINPDTGLVRLIIVLLIMLGIIIFSLFYIKNDKKYLSLLVLLFIPLFVRASCQYRIIINSNIEYKEAKPYNCTYDGELVQGAEYTNGQYTYKYGQEYSYDFNTFEFSWRNISEDGWGVKLTDLESTDSVISPLCSSINSKPIVSMSYMFALSQAPSVDLSSFDTSNVVNMSGMFASNQATNLDLSSFDTSKVTDMNFMFAGSAMTTLDLSSFDTSNVTNMSYMFQGSPITTIDLSSFDTSKVTDMIGMFVGCQLENLDLSSFDTSNVTNMSYMLAYTNISSLNLSSFNTSNVTDMSVMFMGATIPSLNLRNFNYDSIQSITSIFSYSNINSLDLRTLDFSRFGINDFIVPDNLHSGFISLSLLHLYVKDDSSADIIHNYCLCECPNIYVGDTLKYEMITSENCDL